MKQNNGKYIFGVCKIGERGQLVIPKEAREVFDLHAGDSVLVLGDKAKGGIVVLKTEIISDRVYGDESDKD